MSNHAEESVMIHKIMTFKSDTEIVPLLKYINRLHGVETIFSCQGEELEKENEINAYVMFRCSDNSSLTIIALLCNMFLAETQERVDFKIHFEYAPEPLKFVLSFKNKGIMKKFTEFVYKTKLYGISHDAICPELEKELAEKED